MSLFKTIFSFAFQSSATDTVSSTLNDFQINSNASLPDDYYNILFPITADFLPLFQQIVKNIPKATNAFSLVKTFTIIFKAMREKEYEIDVLELLQKIQLPSMSQFEQKGNSWLWELSISVKSYLARLSSVDDVLKRALNFKNKRGETDNQLYLQDMYRLLNAYGLLFPGITSSLNIIGRYYIKTSPYFQQFYRVIKQEILLGYQYIEMIVSHFKKEFKSCEISSIDCFLKTVPQIELYCDRIQEFLMNKYFKGRAPAKKIYIKQEEINQIAYRIQSYQAKSTKSEEIVQTSDEEDFGEFQN